MTAIPLQRRPAKQRGRASSAIDRAELAQRGEPEVIEMSEEEAREFASKICEAILKDGQLRSAIWDLVCCCPNIVTQI